MKKTLMIILMSTLLLSGCGKEKEAESTREIKAIINFNGVEKVLDIEGYQGFRNGAVRISTKNGDTISTHWSNVIITDARD